MDYNTGDSSETAKLNQELRQIAHLLEEKSERLFQLKKKQQQLMLKESLKDSTNPFVDSVMKAY